MDQNQALRQYRSIPGKMNLKDFYRSDNAEDVLKFLNDLGVKVKTVEKEMEFYAIYPA